MNKIMNKLISGSNQLIFRHPNPRLTYSRQLRRSNPLALSNPFLKPSGNVDCVCDPFVNKHKDLRSTTGDPFVKPSDLNIRTDLPPTTVEIPVGSNENIGL